LLPEFEPLLGCQPGDDPEPHVRWLADLAFECEVQALLPNWARVADGTHLLYVPGRVGAQWWREEQLGVGAAARRVLPPVLVGHRAHLPSGWPSTPEGRVVSVVSTRSYWAWPTTSRPGQLSRSARAQRAHRWGGRAGTR